MGILANFIGGAAEAGGNILQRQRESDADLQKQQQYAKYNDDLARARELTTMELRKQYEQERDQYLSSPEYLEMQAKAESAKATSKMDTDEKLAPRARAIKVDDYKAGEMAKLDPEIQALQRKAETEKLTAAEQSKLDFYTANRKAIIGQTRDEALARHIDTGAGLRALQMESARINLDMQKAEAKLPPAVKGSISAIQEQAKAISAAVTKAELDGSASPEAVQKYQARLSELNGQITKLYEPYLSERDRASIAPKSVAGGMQDVRVGGRVIGQAATAEEAAALVARHRQGGGKTPPQAASKETPAPSGPPVDRLRDQPIGILTPLATIREAAAAGNKQAKAYLERRAQGQADTEAAPRTAAEMLNQ